MSKVKRCKGTLRPASDACALYSRSVIEIVRLAGYPPDFLYLYPPPARGLRALASNIVMLEKILKTLKLCKLCRLEGHRS